MLCLTRKVNQRVIIFFQGKRIGSIRLLGRVRPQHARLAIDLPKEFELMREELIEEKAA